MTSMPTAPWDGGRRGTCHLWVRILSGEGNGWKGRPHPHPGAGPWAESQQRWFLLWYQRHYRSTNTEKKASSSLCWGSLRLRKWLVKTAGWWRPRGSGSCLEPREPQKGALPPCVQLRRGQDGFVIRPQASPAVVSPATLYHSDPRWSLVQNTLKCN